MADVHDPLACEFCHTEGYTAEYEAMKAERDALAARVEALEAQRDEALKALPGPMTRFPWKAVEEARRILSGDGGSA